MKRIGEIRRSASRGNAEDAWYLACAYLDGDTPQVRKNARAGFAWLQKAAALGSAEAMIELAVRLAAGENGATDLPQVMAWEKRAFKLGNDLAAHNLAITCSMMSKRKECYRWVLTAVGQGDEDAWLLAGVCLYAGYGVRRNLPKARAAFRNACKSVTVLEDDKVKALKFINMMAHGRPLVCKGSIARVEPECFHDAVALKTYRREKKTLGLPAVFCLGETLFQMKQAGKAAPCLQSCFDAAFCQFEAMGMLSEIYQQLKLPGEEAELYLDWLGKYPQDGFVWGNLGAVYIDQGRFDESLEASSRALSLIKEDKRWVRRNIAKARAGLSPGC